MQSFLRKKEYFEKSDIVEQIEKSEIKKYGEIDKSKTDFNSKFKETKKASSYYK